MAFGKCENVITSEDYSDILLKNSFNSEKIEKLFEESCVQKVNSIWSVLYKDTGGDAGSIANEYGYSSVPGLYGLMDTTAAEAAGVVKILNQPLLSLSGKGTIIGFLDTGIDYSHEAFIDEFGKSRILSIWDQTIEGKAPEGFEYGSEYLRDEINEALKSDNPLEIVPEQDENGHGTFLAGVAAGSQNKDGTFTGAAPKSDIVMIKLKPAKKYLLDYYMINEDAIAYEENDIMLGIRYLKELSEKYNEPMTICIGLGASLGDHNGTCPLSEVLNCITMENGYAVVTAMGNEGNERHHFPGVYSDSAQNKVEIKVGENEKGFMIEMWVVKPDEYSLKIVSPLGNTVIGNATFGEKTREYTFLFENTTVYVDYTPVEALSGQEAVTIRFITPLTGIWQIYLEGIIVINKRFDFWLPIRNFLSGDTYFIRTDPETTLVSPADTESVISVGGYNHNIGTFFLDSGRGYTPVGVIKPDVVAPSVSVYGPKAGKPDSYMYRSGTSIGAAFVAGGAALLLEWGIVKGREPDMNTDIIKTLMSRYARRARGRRYPDTEYGYGEVDIYNIFVNL